MMAQHSANTIHDTLARSEAKARPINILDTGQTILKS